MVNDTIDAGVLGLHLDLDTDNNNNDGIVEPDDASEDSIETDQPKRIFLNNDDDHRDGMVDLDQIDPTPGWDKDFAKTLTGLNSGTPHPGWRLDLIVGSGLRVWATTYKTKLEGSDKFAGTLSFDGDSDSFPSSFYVEGIEVGSASVTAELYAPNGSLYSRDEVLYQVEQTVWPFSDIAVGYQNNNASTWEGLKIGDGWHTSKALVEYIKSPREFDEIATYYPDLENGSRRSNEQLDDSNVQNVDSSVSTLTFDYYLDRRANSYGYVEIDRDGNSSDLQNHSDGDLARLGFVSNSGIKSGAPKREISILDVSGYLEMVLHNGGSLALDANAVDGPKGVLDNGTLDLISYFTGTKHDFQDQTTRERLTGVVYGGSVLHATDNPNMGHSEPQNSSQWIQTILANSNHQLIGDWNNMTIAISESGGPGQTIEVRIKGVVTYSDDNHAGGFGAFTVQAHWGSGVLFKNMRMI